MTTHTETITWHAVTDRLPDAGIVVLIAIIGCEPVRIGKHMGGGGWRCISGEIVGLGCCGGVTHWAEMLVGVPC